MSTAYNFWGFNVRNSRTRDPGAIGVVVNGQKMLDRTYNVARQIVDAGPAGLSVDAVSRTDVETLRSAGVQVTKDPCGTVWKLTEVPAPSHYIVEAAKPATAKRFGQYGSTGISKTN